MYVGGWSAKQVANLCKLRMGQAVSPPVQAAIARGLAYAPFADLLWVETSTPDLAEAKEFAEAIHAKFPGKMLAYNCSPSFNWQRHLDEATIATFQKVRLASCILCMLHSVHPKSRPMHALYPREAW